MGTILHCYTDKFTWFIGSNSTEKHQHQQHPEYDEQGPQDILHHPLVEDKVSQHASIVCQNHKMALVLFRKQSKRCRLSNKIGRSKPLAALPNVLQIT